MSEPYPAGRASQLAREYSKSRNQSFSPMNKITSFILLLFPAVLLNAQVSRDSDLFKMLFMQDSLLFQVGFNTCDVGQFERLVSDDFEFYHDQSGFTPSKEVFINGVRENLCKLNYQPIRKLVEGSLEVFPLKNNGEIYGAVQNGAHRFYAKYPGREEMKLTSTAKFTHVWMIDNGEWKLARVLSFDHQAAGDLSE